MNGLAPQTEGVFEQISKLDCIKDYTLIGGTALALQLNHRLSEDLDFCKWHARNEKIAVDWPAIEKELSSIGVVERNLLAETQCDFVVSGVKLTFLADNKLIAPNNLKKLPFLNNLKIANVESIGVMKLEVMSRRSVYRDYYDMFSILKADISLETIIPSTGVYTSHNLRTKDMLAALVNIETVPMESTFAQLNPIYNVTLQEIQQLIVEKVKSFVENTHRQNKVKITSVLERALQSRQEA